MPAKNKKRNAAALSPLLVLSTAFALFCTITLTIIYRTEIRYFLMGFSDEPVDLRNDYNIHGIDVSRHQGKINWTSVSRFRSNGKNIRFVFMKATEGISLKDPYFKRNWNMAKNANLIRGAYHYFRPELDPELQAANFIQMVRLVSNDLPPVADIEEFNGRDERKFRRNIKIFLERLTKHYGVRPLVYSSPTFYNKYLRSHFDEYPLWIAHYRKHYKPRVSRNWHFWQYTENGRIKGISTPVDINVFNGEMGDLKKLLLP